MKKMAKTEERDLHRWCLIEEFRKSLTKELEHHPRHSSEDDPRRKLHYLDYASSILFTLFNPVLKSMRGLCATLISIIYRQRWQIEVFFKWLKSILGCRKLLAESSNGVAIQMYCALIAAIMLFDLFGKKANYCVLGNNAYRRNSPCPDSIFFHIERLFMPKSEAKVNHLDQK